MVGTCEGNVPAASEVVIGRIAVAVGSRGYDTGAGVEEYRDDEEERMSTLETTTYAGLERRPAIASPAAAPPNMERKETQPEDEPPAAAPPDMKDRKNWAAAAPHAAAPPS